MMTDQHLPLLEATPMLAEVPLLPHMISRDGMQQVILVQVNPGEAFAIRTEDGQFQCITGPAQVPMVSPNGTMPPIFVPPGYISQVVEENGMRKVLVLPHAVEFHPSIPPVPPHLPLYTPPHPAMLHHPHMFPTEHPHYVHHLPALPIYTEQDMMCHSMSVPIHEERSMKMQEQLQRRVKSGHLGTANGVPLPHSPPGMFIKGGQSAMHTGNSKGRLGLAASPTPPRLKHSGRTRASPTSIYDIKDPEEELRRVQELLSAICKPTVDSVTSQSAVLSWCPPLPMPSEGETLSHTSAHTALLLSYELVLSQRCTEGDFKLVYQGKDTTYTVGDLRPATHYHARVCVVCSSVKGAPSETVTFTTLCSAPDPPAVPRLIQSTKSSIVLQWRSPNDNGSKITGFCLEYHEGKQSAFKEVYSGLAKQYKVMQLMPSTEYAFRLAAVNDVGMSAFSAVLNCCTAGCTASPPAQPSPPRLTEAGVTWLSLQWDTPCGSLSRDTFTYILEMEDKGLDNGFQLKYRGEEQLCMVKELRRFTTYRFRVLVTDSEGTSQPSAVVEYKTLPDQPGSPGKLSLLSPVQPHSLHVVWEVPEDDGGSPITQYILELNQSEGQWNAVYNGPLKQHVCEGLLEGTQYKLRVYCQSMGGQSPVSEILSIETPPLPPGQCRGLHIAGVPTPSEIPLCWDPPVCDGGAPVSQFCVEMAQSAEEFQQQVFCGSDVCCTVDHLLPGRTYLFWVKAFNSAGWGPLSESCGASTAPGLPEQCSAPDLTLKTSTSVLVTWQTPLCNGAKVCEFRMEWGLEKGTLELLYCGPSLQYQVTDLQPATEYYCRVQAVSGVGAGLFSDVATITTPPSVPAAVEHVEEMHEEPLCDVIAKSPASTLAVRWKEPHCHGAEISSYNIDIGDEIPMFVGRTTYHILENLQPDTTYRIRVQAVNSMGPGPFSSALKLKTKARPPDPPVLECVVAGPQSLKLKWGEGPSKPQNSRGTHYCLHMQVGSDRSVCIYSGPCHTFKVQRLCEATEYLFSIQAHSMSGMGPLSPSYTFSTTRSPPPQLKAPKVDFIEWNKYTVTWEALQPMKGDPIMYTLQLLRGHEVEQLYKGPATTYIWQNPTANATCRLRVCAGRRSQDGSELWGQCSLSTSLPVTDLPREHRTTCCHDPQPKRSWPLTDEPFATILLLGFVILAVLFAVVIQYFVIERQ